jgi:8-oxo-dGTP pyrophosphatase MutT (NUDIX family)
LPGGIIEENESPRQACTREVQEELGIACDIRRLLCVDYSSSQGDWTEKLEFVFLGGLLSEKQIQTIKIAEEELKEYQFIRCDQIDLFLSSIQSKIVELCLMIKNSESTLYLENETPV